MGGKQTKTTTTTTTTERSDIKTKEDSNLFTVNLEVEEKRRKKESNNKQTKKGESFIPFINSLLGAPKHVFVTTKHVFCCDKSMFVVIKLLSRQQFYRDKLTFVATNTCLSRQ